MIMVLWWKAVATVISRTIKRESSETIATVSLAVQC